MREAIIRLDDRYLEAIGLADVVAATREAGLRSVTELVCHGAGGVLQVRVDEPIPPGDLDGFEAVEWWERLPSPGSGVTYLCKVEPTNPPEGGSLDDLATAHEVAAVTADGIELSVIGTQQEISESVAAIGEAGMTPLLQRLAGFEGAAPNPTERLTDRQREVLKTAYAMGYYEVPRAASTDAVADSVELDPSTVSEHLQRAERNILGQVLETAD